MPDEKRLTVHDQRRKAYSRVISTRPVTFACAECGAMVTEELFPSATPCYCNDCVAVVRRRQATERKRRQRARRKETGET